MKATVIIASLCCAVAGCASEARNDDATYTQTDSAGVTIVHSMRPSWPESGGWQLAAEPMLLIGEEDGAAEYLFSRVAGVRMIDDTVLLVADGRSNELRFFDVSGRFLHSVGREGQGPGEFEYLAGLPNCYSDSIIAADIGDRLSIFTKAGEFVRLVRSYGSPQREVSPYQFACGPEGLTAVNGWGAALTDPEIGFFRAFSHVYAGSITEGAQVDLGEFIASERWGHENGSRPHPFGRQTRLAIDGVRFYVGTSMSHEVRVYAPDGALRSLIRWDGDDLTLTEDVANEYFEWEIQRAPQGAQASWRRQFAEMTLPDTRPAYSELLVDAVHNLWVREFDPMRDATQRWLVFDSSGGWIGRIAFPPRYRVTEILADRVVGVATDDLGIERVAVYRLHKADQDRGVE
jgi:hypothetical protein